MLFRSNRRAISPLTLDWRSGFTIEGLDHPCMWLWRESECCGASEFRPAGTQAPQDENWRADIQNSHPE